MNVPSIIALVFVGFCFVAAVAYMIKHKNFCGGCSGNCAECRGARRESDGAKNERKTERESVREEKENAREGSGKKDL